MSKTFKFLFVFILFYGLINKAYHEAWDYQLMDVKLIAGREYFRISDISPDRKYAITGPPGDLQNLISHKSTDLPGIYRYFIDNEHILTNLGTGSSSDQDWFIYNYKTMLFISKEVVEYGDNWLENVENLIPNEIVLINIGEGHRLIYFENESKELKVIEIILPYIDRETSVADREKLNSLGEIFESNQLNCNQGNHCVSPNGKLYFDGEGVYTISNEELIFSLNENKLDFFPNANDLFKPFKVPKEIRYYGWNSESTGIYALAGNRGIINIPVLGMGKMINFPYVFIEIPIPIP